MQHVHGQNATIQNVIDVVSKKPVAQQVLNQYGTQYVDNRAVHQQQNVLNDNRSVAQNIVNLAQNFQQGGSSSSSSGNRPPAGGGGGGGGGSGGGGGGGRPMAIDATQLLQPSRTERRRKSQIHPTYQFLYTTAVARQNVNQRFPEKHRPTTVRFQRWHAKLLQWSKISDVKVRWCLKSLTRVLQLLFRHPLSRLHGPEL